MSLNKILTTSNQPLDVALYSMLDPNGDPQLLDSLAGLPLGASNNASDGELAVKVIVVATRNGPTGVQQAITVATKSADYTVPAGASSININFSSDFAGTVQGATYVDLMNPFSVSADPAALLRSLVITCSAGSFVVSELRVV